jgi:hypothetical protein
VTAPCLAANKRQEQLPLSAIANIKHQASIRSRHSFKCRVTRVCRGFLLTLCHRRRQAGRSRPITTFRSVVNSSLDCARRMVPTPTFSQGIAGGAIFLASNSEAILWVFLTFRSVGPFDTLLLRQPSRSTRSSQRSVPGLMRCCRLPVESLARVRRLQDAEGPPSGPVDMCVGSYALTSSIELLGSRLCLCLGSTCCRNTAIPKILLR